MAQTRMQSVRRHALSSLHEVRVANVTRHSIARAAATAGPNLNRELNADPKLRPDEVRVDDIVAQRRQRGQPLARLPAPVIGRAVAPGSAAGWKRGPSASCPA